MSETVEPLVNFSIKLKPSEIEAFQLFKSDLQERVPNGKVTTRLAFLSCVGSATALLESGQIPQPQKPRQAASPLAIRSDQTAA